MRSRMTSPAVRRYYLITAVTLFVPLLLSRLVSVWHSYAATDILYMTTALPPVLYWVRRALTVLAFAAGIAAVVTAVYRFGVKEGRATLCIHASMLFLDFFAAFLIDVISGAVSGGSVLTALLVGVGGFLWNALFSLLAYFSACRCLKRDKTPERALTLGAVWYLAGRLFLEITYLLDFLIDVEFLPYPEEIAVIVGEFLSIVALDGGALWIAALVFAVLLRRICRNHDKFTNNL